MRKEIVILGAIVLIVIAAAIFGASYYRNSVQNVSVTAGNNSNTANKPRADAGQLIRPDSPTLGPADAKVTLVEFYDPECETCAEFGPIVKKILKDYDGRIRYVARFLPLHPNSITAATFIETAGEQGKYWQAQELLFEKQPEWGTKHGPPPATPPPPINQLFDKYAAELGLDTDKAAKSVSEKRFEAKIQLDKKDAQSLGARQTPTFFVNGRMLAKFGEPGLRELIEEEMKK